MADLAIVGGGAGFIGRHLVRHLASIGLDVLVLDRCPIDLPDVQSRVLDLTDRQAVLDALRGLRPHWIFNLTGIIDHTIQWPDQREIINQNLLSVLNLLEALDEHPPAAFVNVGSSDEYGDNPAPQHESLRERSIAPYSAAKSMATHYLQMWHRRTGFPAVVARFFLIYGPEQDMRRLIPWACMTLLRGETMPASEGLQKRDFLYVQDAVEGLVKLAETPAAQGQVFNVASGEPVAVREVLETIHEVVGRGSVDFGARPMRDGEIMELYADISRVKQVVGWQPTTDLREGLARTVTYYRAQVDG